MTARKTTTARVSLASVDHAATSAMGNPTYRLTTDDGRTFLTGTNAGIGYAATNYRPRYPATSRAVVLHLDGRGRVWDITNDDARER